MISSNLSDVQNCVLEMLHIKIIGDRLLPTRKITGKYCFRLFHSNINEACMSYKRNSNVAETIAYWGRVQWNEGGAVTTVAVVVMSKSKRNKLCEFSF